MYGNYLVHHGVKGQHWGVRRYQNADGTLTSEGKQHYAKGNGNERHQAAQPQQAPHKGKRLRDMSNSEIQEKVKRLQLERQYRDLVNSEPGKAARNEGVNFAKDIGKTLAKNVITKVGTEILSQIGISILGAAVNKVGGKLAETPAGRKIDLDPALVNLKKAKNKKKKDDDDDD